MSTTPSNGNGNGNGDGNGTSNSIASEGAAQSAQYPPPTNRLSSTLPTQDTQALRPPTNTAPDPSPSSSKTPQNRTSSTTPESASNAAQENSSTPAASRGLAPPEQTSARSPKNPASPDPNVASGGSSPVPGRRPPSQPVSRRSSRASQRDGTSYRPWASSRLVQSHAPGTSPDQERQPSGLDPPGPPAASSERLDGSGWLTPQRSPPLPPVTGLGLFRDPDGFSDTARGNSDAHAAESKSIDERSSLLDHAETFPAAAAPGRERTRNIRPPLRDTSSFGGRSRSGYHTPQLSNGGSGNFSSVTGGLSSFLNNYRTLDYGDRGSIRSVATALPGFEGGKSDMSTTQWLANKQAAKGQKMMYIRYYFPFCNWIRQYRLRWLLGDLVAALTMASFYLPISLSYASNLAHVPPIQGLYSFVVNPLIYALLGTCPQMVVGPEAAGSLLVGSVIRSSVDKGISADDEDALHARIAGVVTGMAGAIILGAGVTRLGFLDSVLSRPFLRGFISAIGFVILVDQLIPEMGLTRVQRGIGADHGSSADKIMFLIQHIGQAHALTCWLSFGTFAITMTCRELKRRYQPKYSAVAYIPDRFILVVLSAVLTYACGWNKQGLAILGEVKSSTGSLFSFHFPFVPAHMTHVREALSTSFLIALLGFFESSVAAKSLSSNPAPSDDSVQGMIVSPNRELVALGVANVVGGCFMALPAFGGYGRSKVNAATGGKTPMSSIFLSLITIITVSFLLPYLYYLPKGVLSAMVSVVAWSLVEEAPHDIRFFLRVHGWSELALMLSIFAATVFYSLPLGIACGLGFSVLSVIKHATKPRIQILGRVPGESRFESAEADPAALEFFEGCLIVKIPEPLTFANTGVLKLHLERAAAHPALPRVQRDRHDENVVFDIHGVTSIDASGTQILSEIIDTYLRRGVRVWFCRAPAASSRVMQLFRRAGIVDAVGGEAHFVKSVDEALRLAERAAERAIDQDRNRYRDEV